MLSLPLPQCHRAAAVEICFFYDITAHACRLASARYVPKPPRKLFAEPDAGFCRVCQIPARNSLLFPVHASPSGLLAASSLFGKSLTAPFLSLAGKTDSMGMAIVMMAILEESLLRTRVEFGMRRTGVETRPVRDPILALSIIKVISSRLTTIEAILNTHALPSPIHTTTTAIARRHNSPQRSNPFRSP